MSNPRSMSLPPYAVEGCRRFLPAVSVLVMVASLYAVAWLPEASTEDRAQLRRSHDTACVKPYGLKVAERCRADQGRVESGRSSSQMV
jgi:hypothetical protein